MNNRRYIGWHTKTGNQEKVSCFFASIFVILKNCQYYTVQGGLKEILSLVWQIRKAYASGMISLPEGMLQEGNTENEETEGYEDEA